VPSLGDQAVVVKRPVLVGEQHQRSVGSAPRGPARGDEQHQREQAGHLRLVGHQDLQHPGQPDGLVAQLVTDQLRAAGRDVALGEQQVQHVEDGGQAVGQLVTVGHPVRDPGVADLGLRAADPLRDGRLGALEQPRDLRGR
jgi:hypothetical protein